ncbi:hypothetical protein B0J11DRAFT_602558 [Dendryphion nanum]|uniref:C2H2-type domain-containing protein n=1 Tax=Dendryphion nanum TaxID=256645 RepID=A0A9P9IR97_9PLEO|nr:hypothetical protein B0J11DRAFT_602558 [Dendryphion nanum]
MAFPSSPVLKCFCGRSYSNSTDLEEHRRARGHFAAHVCKEGCEHPVISEAVAGIKTCGSCGKVCERADILVDHRIATGHCFCTDCNIVFENQNALDVHRQTKMHASKFECCDCNIPFDDIHALNAHIASGAHQKPFLAKRLRKSTNPACEKCKLEFRSIDALQQHLLSLKHNPISNLKCPMGKGCQQRFKSPSALLHHLESGRCKSGMDRREVYQIVQACDEDGMIHKTSALSISNSSMFLTSESDQENEGGVHLVRSDSEWSVALTPKSQSISENFSEEWSMLEGSQISFSNSSTLDTKITQTFRCPLCPANRKPFASAFALQQHMSSPAHCAKIYHCPSNMPMGEYGKKSIEKHFKTLGGLAQHMETGACYGGKKAFFNSLGFIQQFLERAGYGKIPLLLPGICK